MLWLTGTSAVRLPLHTHRTDCRCSPSPLPSLSASFCSAIVPFLSSLILLLLCGPIYFISPVLLPYLFTSSLAFPPFDLQSILAIFLHFLSFPSSVISSLGLIPSVNFSSLLSFPPFLLTLLFLSLLDVSHPSILSSPVSYVLLHLTASSITPFPTLSTFVLSALSPPFASPPLLSHLFALP